MKNGKELTSIAGRVKINKQENIKEKPYPEYG